MNVSIVYDGRCPVCRRVAALSRLRDRSGVLELVDARTGAIDSIQGRDLRHLDFDEGFAVVVDGAIHHGAEGAHALALLTEPSGIGFRLFQSLARDERRSRVLYPFLRAGRNLLLRIMGIPRIGPPGG